MLQQENFCSICPQDVRSNTRYVHLIVTPSAAQQFNCRLPQLRGIKGCGDRTIGYLGF